MTILYLVAVDLSQVPTVPAGHGVGDQQSAHIKLTWRQGQPAPESMTSYYGAAVGHGSTAYFSRDHNIYSYTVPENKWTKLPQCKYQHFAMAVINDALTTVGGRGRKWPATNTLLSLSGSSWEEVLPPMPTKRVHPAAANTPTHLVVGGKQSLINHLSTVEVLNTKTLQWSAASSLPKAIPYPQMTIHGRSIYLTSSDVNVFFSVEGFAWTRLARIPTLWWSTPATLRGCVLAIGGADAQYGGNPTGAIHCYDMTTNSWSVIGEMPTPRSDVLTAVLPSNELVVVGGWNASGICSRTIDIGTCSSHTSSQLTLK